MDMDRDRGMNRGMDRGMNRGGGSGVAQRSTSVSRLWADDIYTQPIQRPGAAPPARRTADAAALSCGARANGPSRVVPIRAHDKPVVSAAIRKVLITDDHSLIRFGIAALVSRLLPSATVLHQATRLGTLQALCTDAEIGLLVVDLTLTDSHGLRIVEDIVALRPLMPLVVISGSEDGVLARRALALGVLGFVSKSADANLTEHAFKLILAGGRYIPGFAFAGSLESDGARANLTERQAEVMRLMCEGMSNKQIASSLELTEATVKGHLTTVFRVLKVSSRSQAILAAQRLATRI